MPGLDHAGRRCLTSGLQTLRSTSFFNSTRLSDIHGHHICRLQTLSLIGIIRARSSYVPRQAPHGHPDHIETTRQALARPRRRLQQRIAYRFILMLCPMLQLSTLWTFSSPSRSGTKIGPAGPSTKPSSRLSTLEVLSVAWHRKHFDQCNSLLASVSPWGKTVTFSFVEDTKKRST